MNQRKKEPNVPAATRMLYRQGTSLKVDGEYFDYCVVLEDEVEGCLEDGWFLTTTDALAASDEGDTETEASSEENEDDEPADSVEENDAPSETEEDEAENPSDSSEDEAIEDSQGDASQEPSEREKLEKEADGLGVDYRSNMKDETLRTRIEAAKKENSGELD